MNIAEAKRDLAQRTKRGFPSYNSWYFILGCSEYNGCSSFRKASCVGVFNWYGVCVSLRPNDSCHIKN